MKNIIFYCNWGNNTNELLNRYKKNTKNNLGIWNNLNGVIDINIADIVIFVEGIPNNFDLNCLKNKKVICFPREPFVNKNWEKYNFRHGYTYDNFFHVFTNPEFIAKTYDFLNDLKYTTREKKLSAIISNKNCGIGYSLRRNLLIKMSKEYPDLCDIYGSGWCNELGTSYKGKLNAYHNDSEITKTKYDGLINYNYSLCIENCNKDNYFTEKITDAILCWTIPIYYGCTNISKYFPKDSYYEINIRDENCIEQIKTIINKPITEKNILALKEARNLILNKYNIWNMIENVDNSNYIYTQNWFHNSEIKNNLLKYVNVNSINKILEIGTFEGAAACFFSDYLLNNNNSYLDCVDPFYISGSVENITTKFIDNNTINTFKSNIKKSKNSNKVKLYQETSDEFFEKNKKLYNIIYIDGCHEYEFIIRDMVNSFNCLEINGIMWMDDYGGGNYPNYCKIPMDKFLNEYNGKYLIIHKGYQLALKKIK